MLTLPSEMTNGDEVLVKVHAVAVTRADCATRNANRHMPLSCARAAEKSADEVTAIKARLKAIRDDARDHRLTINDAEQPEPYLTLGEVYRFTFAFTRK